MSTATPHIAAIAGPVITTLAAVETVAGIVCFGSYALGIQDSESDLDLYVICDPKITPDSIRSNLLKQIPGSTGLSIQQDTPVWNNSWAPQMDRLTINPVVFDIAYTTYDWVAHVVQQVLTTGALTLPEMPFRPDTLFGLIAHAIVLYYPHGIVHALKSQQLPYPAVLKANLLCQSLAVMADSLAELRDYTRRNIGPCAFLFHPGRVCDAMVSALYALNEHYDPATKRPEEVLRKLAVLPAEFVDRFVHLLAGPFDLKNRPHVVHELMRLEEEIRHLAHRDQLVP